jgi:hypothetical protein
VFARLTYTAACCIAEGDMFAGDAGGGRTNDSGHRRAGSACSTEDGNATRLATSDG